MRRLTIEEKETLTELWNAGYKYIARDEGGNLFIYSSSKIEKFMSEWCYNDDKGVHFSFAFFNNLFKMVKWEDEEPTLISDLLCEAEPFCWPK